MSRSKMRLDPSWVCSGDWAGVRNPQWRGSEHGRLIYCWMANFLLISVIKEPRSKNDMKKKYAGVFTHL